MWHGVKFFESGVDLFHFFLIVFLFFNTSSQLCNVLGSKKWNGKISVKIRTFRGTSRLEWKVLPNRNNFYFRGKTHTVQRAKTHPFPPIVYSLSQLAHKLFQRPSNVHSIQKTLYEHRTNVVCQLDFYNKIYASWW